MTFAGYERFQKATQKNYDQHFSQHELHFILEKIIVLSYLPYYRLAKIFRRGKITSTKFRSQITIFERRSFFLHKFFLRECLSRNLSPKRLHGCVFRFGAETEILNLELRKKYAQIDFSNTELAFPGVCLEIIHAEWLGYVLSAQTKKNCFTFSDLCKLFLKINQTCYYSMTVYCQFSSINTTPNLHFL